MEVGIGLPNAIPGTEGKQLVEFASAATDEETVKQYLSAFEEAGCDELVLFPSSPDPEQVDLLAKAAL